MEQNLKQNEKKDSRLKVITYIYLTLMLLSYLSYIALDNYLIYQYEKLVGKGDLTQEDIYSLTQLGEWKANTELIFISLFVLAIVVSIIISRYRKNIRLLTRFLLVNICLLVIIFILSYALKYIVPSPIGNLTQPLYIPGQFLGVLAIYLAIMMLMGRTSKRV